MSITLLHPAALPLQGGVNFRDQGGYRVKDGRRVKYGMLFRSGTLDELTEKDCQYLTERKLGHILDYRDADEVQSKPDAVWANAQYKNIAANPIATDVNANLDKLTIDTLASFDPADFMSELYDRLPFNNGAYRYLVELMQQPDERGIVQHCAVGKDRTGVGSAIVLFILGADQDTVMEDYLITETTLAPYKEKMLDHLAGKLDKTGVERFDYVLSAKPEFLDRSFKAIKARYQSIDRWLENEFDLTPQKRENLQSKYLDN
jgi:protein-tyrosine phosphatase